MQIFRIERPFTLTDFIRGLCYSIVVISIPLVLNLFFSPYNLKGIYSSGYYIVPGVLLLYYLIDTTSSRKVTHITFDPSHHQLTLLKEAPLLKPKSLVLPLAAIHLEVERTTSKWFGTTFSIAFLKGKREVEKIRRSKGGFSESTLLELVAVAENYGLAIQCR